MKHFSDTSCEKIMSVSLAIDKAILVLDELPECERLSDIIEKMSNLVARLDAILADEKF